MRSTIRNIGNSKGIILPRNLLKQCSIKDDVDIEVRDSMIIISPARDNKREGWAKAFMEMAEAEDDTLIIPDVFNDEDLNDWTWK